MTGPTHISILALFALLASVCPLLKAQSWTPDGVGARGSAVRAVAERRVSLSQAVEIVQRATHGKVLDAKDLGSHYRIKVLTPNGEVRVVHVDAQTGAMRD